MNRFDKFALGAALALVALPALGFGPAGVAAGSVAAGIQATIGNVAAGSAFAALQSLGATIVTVGTRVALAFVGGFIASFF